MKKILKGKIFKNSLKILISLGFVAWLIFKIKWNEVLFYLGQVNYWQIALYLAIVVSGIFISAFKWRMLAKFKGIHRPFSDFFKYYLTGTFINNFMPGFLGGDTYRSYEIGKKEGKFAQAASSVMMDRITGLVGATVLALIFSLINMKTVMGNKVLLVANVLIFISFIFDLFLAKIKSIPAIKNQAKRFLPEKITEFFHELGLYSSDHGILVKSVMMGGVFSIVGMALANYVLLLAFGVHIGIINYLSVIFIITIVSSIPISINNIGLKEWAFVTFFGIFGVNSAAVTAVSIVSRFLQMFISFAALPMYLKTKKDREVIEEKGLEEI